MSWLWSIVTCASQTKVGQSWGSENNPMSNFCFSLLFSCLNLAVEEEAYAKVKPKLVFKQNFIFETLILIWVWIHFYFIYPFKFLIKSIFYVGQDKIVEVKGFMRWNFFVERSLKFLLIGGLEEMLVDWNTYLIIFVCLLKLRPNLRKIMNRIASCLF